MCEAENPNLFYIEPINRGIGQISIFIAAQYPPSVSPVPHLTDMRTGREPLDYTQTHAGCVRTCVDACFVCVNVRM